jgi:hypothetical protein
MEARLRRVIWRNWSKFAAGVEICTKRVDRDVMDKFSKWPNSSRLEVSRVLEDEKFADAMEFVDRGDHCNLAASSAIYISTISDRWKSLSKMTASCSFASRRSHIHVAFSQFISSSNSPTYRTPFSAPVELKFGRALTLKRKWVRPKSTLCRVCPDQGEMIEI